MQISTRIIIGSAKVFDTGLIVPAPQWAGQAYIGTKQSVFNYL